MARAIENQNGNPGALGCRFGLGKNEPTSLKDSSSLRDENAGAFNQSLAVATSTRSKLFRFAANSCSAAFS